MKAAMLIHAFNITHTARVLTGLSKMSELYVKIYDDFRASPKFGLN